MPTPNQVCVPTNCPKGGCWTHLTFYITKRFTRGIQKSKTFLGFSFWGLRPQTPAGDSAHAPPLGHCFHTCILLHTDMIICNSAEKAHFYSIMPRSSVRYLVMWSAC